MTRVIAQKSDDWAFKKIAFWLGMEMEILKKQIEKSRSKILDFEKKHKKVEEEYLYKEVDDMELIEWEGKIEVLSRLQNRLKSLNSNLNSRPY